MTKPKNPSDIVFYSDGEEVMRMDLCGYLDALGIWDEKLQRPKYQQEEE